jgi:flavin-dependent dehydrogenase
MTSAASSQKTWSRTHSKKRTDLHSKVLNNACGLGWVAAGDASMSFDPLSSMGIGFAISSGIQAAHAINSVICNNAQLFNHYTADIHKQFNEYKKVLAGFYASENSWTETNFGNDI